MKMDSFEKLMITDLIHSNLKLRVDCRIFQLLTGMRLLLLQAFISNQIKDSKLANKFAIARVARS